MLAASERSAVAGGRAPCGVVHGRAHPLDVDQRVGQHVLDGLEGADGLAELHAVLRVVDRHRQHAIGRTEHLGAGQGGRPVQQERGGRRRRRGGAPGVPSNARTPSSRVRSMAGHGGRPSRACAGRPRRRRRPPRPRPRPPTGRRRWGRLPAAGAPARPLPTGGDATGRRRPGDTPDRGALAERLPPVQRGGVGRPRRRSAAPRASDGRRNGAATRRRPISSHSTATSTMPSPRPPSSSGTSMASHPWSAMADHTAAS